MILAYIENNGVEVPKGSLSTIQAALLLKKAHNYSGLVGLLLGGDGTEEAAKKVAAFGLDEVLYVKNNLLKTYLATNYALAFKKVLETLAPTVVLALADTRGRDLMPRISQHLDAGQASDVIEFVDGGRFKRPMYAGNVLATVEITTARKVVTVRQSAFDVAKSGASECPIRELSIDISADSGMEFLSFDTVKSARPQLVEADRIVSGGVSLKSKENFEKYIVALADVLGAAVGASRAAVDAEYAPNDWQVGQTGKIVAPKLYIAVGISGAIQHIAGMKSSKTIVAINKDPEAPIFDVADYGLVADLYQAVPELISVLTASKS